MIRPAGLFVSWLGGFLSSTFSMMTWQVSKWPFLAAQCKGVQPATFAGFWKRNFNQEVHQGSFCRQGKLGCALCMDVWWTHRRWNYDQLTLSCGRHSMMNLTTRECPFDAAQCSGVQPLVSGGFLSSVRSLTQSFSVIFLLSMIFAKSETLNQGWCLLVSWNGTSTSN